MNAMDELAEARIREAMERGEFDGLPGEGRPLALDDDSMVPAELRMAYRILRNANCLPPELDARREIRELEDLLRHVEDVPAETRRRAQRRLLVLRMRLEAGSGRRSGLGSDPAYRERLTERLDRGDDPDVVS